MEPPDTTEQEAPNDGAGLPARARSIYQRLRLVAQLLREAPPTAGSLLLWRDHRGVVRSHALKQQVIVGRDDSCGIVLTQRRVSRRHCRVWTEQGQAWIEDLESTAGIVINGQRTCRQHLREGDLLDIGGTILAYVSGK